MVTAELLQTWYSENAIRRFPLDSAADGLSTSGAALPDALLVGMELSIPSTMTVIDPPGSLEEPLYTPYISKVIISEYEVVVTVAANGIDVAQAVVDVSDIPDNKETKGFVLSSIAVEDADFDGVGGKLFFGPLSGFLPYGGIYEFAGPENTGISWDCIHSYPECIRAFNIGGTRVTGDVILEEGENISIDYDETTNTITVSYVPDDIEGISDRDALIEAITDRYGVPICTINGVVPDAEGNFEFFSAPGSCMEVDVADHGISIVNPCASPCCDKTVLETLMEDIQGLNARYARLNSYLTSATANVNTLQNELSILKMSMK